MPAADERRIHQSHHLYVHVPFCRLVCAYCDFVTVGGRADDIPRYVAALRAELTTRSHPGELRTVYLGGGTPSLLSGTQVAGLLDDARQAWGSVRLEEVTLEANPSERERPDWPGLHGAGVDRVSLGMQSLRDEDLDALARGHTAQEARAAYLAARAAGFANISVDLIYGIPGQTLEGWADGLDRAIELEPDHVSCYALQLALEPDEWAAPPRAGALRWRRRVAAAQDDVLAAEQYGVAEERLAAAGFRHYELSSWALPGREARHNAAYWDRRGYTGLGAGAHSFDGDTERSWNTRDLDAYLARAEAGERPVAGRERLDFPTRAFEAIALGLRRVDGMRLASYREEFGVDPLVAHEEAIRDTVVAGLLEVTPEALRLSRRGRLLASEALVAFAPAPSPRR